MLCDHATLFSQESDMHFRCSTMREPCAILQSEYNFFQLYSCYLRESKLVFFPLCIVLIYTALMIMSTAIDHYLAPSITYLRYFLAF